MNNATEPNGSSKVPVTKEMKGWEDFMNSVKINGITFESDGKESKKIKVTSHKSASPSMEECAVGKVHKGRGNRKSGTKNGTARE